MHRLWIYRPSSCWVVRSMSFMRSKWCRMCPSAACRSLWLGPQTDSESGWFMYQRLQASRSFWELVFRKPLARWWPKVPACGRRFPFRGHQPSRLGSPTSITPANVKCFGPFTVANGVLGLDTRTCASLDLASTQHASSRATPVRDTRGLRPAASP